MKLLTIITVLSLIIATSLTSYAQEKVNLANKLNEAQKRLPMSRIQVDQLDRYYDSEFIGRRVQRLESINMQMQGRIMFLENLVADIVLGGGIQNINQQQNRWTCAIENEYIGTDHTKLGARAAAINVCKKNYRSNCSQRDYECEQSL